jgi:hypothetical protein
VARQQKGGLQKTVREQQQESYNGRNVAEQGLETGAFRKKVMREDGENTVVRKEQQRNIGELESERHGQEGTIARQPSETEGLKAAGERCEDELKPGAEANSAQRREPGQMKDENESMKAKDDQFMKGLLNKSSLPNIGPPWPKPPPVKVLPLLARPKPGTQSPPSTKKEKIQIEEGWGRNKKTADLEIGVPDRIIGPACQAIWVN